MKHQKLKTTPEVSKRMSHVKLKNGKAEVKLAKKLWSMNIRYRKNYRKLPGSPDIAISKYKIAIFVDGEFWHGYKWEEKKDKLKSNKEYWIEKIEENISRDIRNDRLLRELGWIPVHFWERDINKNLDDCILEIQKIIYEIENNIFDK